jgi:hypothetical protein
VIAPAIAAALAVMLALAAAGPTALLVAALAVVQGMVAARWFSAAGAPGAPVGSAVGAAAGVAATVSVAVRDDQRPLAPLAAVLGLVVLAALLHQLARRDGRDALTTSLAATTTLGVVAALGAGHLAAAQSKTGTPLVVAAVLAAAAVVATDAASLPSVHRPLPGAARALAGLALGALLGLLAGLWSGLGSGTGALVALGGAAVAMVAVLLAHRLARPEPVLTAGLPLLLTGPAAFVLGRLFAG